MTSDQTVRNGPRLTENLSLIQTVITRVGRARGVPGDEADDFRSFVFLKLLENQRRILLRFRGESSLRTYLDQVVGRLLLDFRRAKWGKWRPSAAAGRLGAVGVELERIVHRDNVPAREAIRVVKARHPGLGSTTLQDALAKLPQRRPRHFEGEEVLDLRPAKTKSPDVQVVEAQHTQWRPHIERAFSQAFRRLDAIDRRILRLRFHRRFKVPEIARRLNLEPKSVYRRCDHLLKQLRIALEAQGITAEMVAELTGRPSTDFRLDFAESESA